MTNLGQAGESSFERGKIRLAGLNGEYHCRKCNAWMTTSDPDKIKSQLCNSHFATAQTEFSAQQNKLDTTEEILIIEESPEERYERVRKEQAEGQSIGNARTNAVNAAVARTTRKTPDKDFILKVKQYFEEFKKIV